MAKKEARELNIDVLVKKPAELDQLSFNLDKQDQLVMDRGVSFIHYKAIPSPIGLKDRGDYRRSESLDTISENGFIYKKCGEFLGTIVGNGKQNPAIEGGLFDNSTARLILPRFYDNDKKEYIMLAPGDRVFIRDTEVPVVNYQRVEYNPNGEDFLQYPAVKVEFIMDSLGREFNCGKDFSISKDGNIKWNKSGKNPGIDADTGKGRIYSIRYHYNAHWYIAQLLNEVRVSNVTENGIHAPARMPYQAVIQREYVYHNRNRGDSVDTNHETTTERTVPKQTESNGANDYKVKVNLNYIE